MYSKVTFRALNLNRNHLKQFDLKLNRKKNYQNKSFLSISNNQKQQQQQFKQQLRQFSDLNKHEKLETEESPIEAVHKPLLFKQIGNWLN